MTRAIVSLSVQLDHPPLVHGAPGDGHLTPFGRWLRERVASIAVDWPGIGFHRISMNNRTVRIHLIPHSAVPPMVAAMAVARSIARETGRAAVKWGWVADGVWIWDGAATVLLVDAASNDPAIKSVEWVNEAADWPPVPSQRQR